MHIQYLLLNITMQCKNAMFINIFVLLINHECNGIKYKLCNH